MKTVFVQAERFLSQPVIPMPNAATRRQLLHKILDRLLVTASCAGIVAVLLFLLCL